MSEESPQGSPDYITSRVASLIAALFLLSLMLYGGCITGLVLKEPDICFLLGGGRWIIEHGQIPLTDPFSYTTHYHPVPYVIEKWLTEVIFYCVFAKLGGVGLLVFDALVLALAFVVMPYRILYRCGWRGFAAMGLTLVAVLTSGSHLAIRPEIFSFLFAAVWLEVLILVSGKTAGNTVIDWRSIGLIAFLMCLWSNLHTLFMVGVLLPGLYCGCIVLEQFCPGLKDKPINWTVPIMTVACFAATLINPYGIGLWGYLPNVFGPFNDTNNEMQSIKLSTIANPIFFPFYFLIILGLKAAFKSLRKPLRQGDIFFNLLVPLGAAGGVKTIRSIPLADLFLVAGIARSKRPHDDKKMVTLGSIATHLDHLANPMTWKWTLLCVLMPAIGAYAMTSAVPPEIPQGSKAFVPPFKAIEYIKANPPKGNLLNDPHFGATMIWRMNPNPPVFIDPRYNLYGNGLLQDYWKMVGCAPGWRDLMRHYDIGWVFLPPGLNLSRELSHDPDWVLLYSDGKSVVCSRKRAGVSDTQRQ